MKITYITPGRNDLKQGWHPILTSSIIKELSLILKAISNKQGKQKI